MKEEISNREFAVILKKAKTGDMESIYKIIKLYEGAIVNESIIKGRYSQECRDYIEECIIKDIKKFKKI